MPDTRRGAITRLHALADKLEARLYGDNARDRLAYDQLAMDPDRQPWTAAAQQTWEKGGGPWRAHHLAIAYHARAYDLEQQGKAEQAHPYWVKALKCWADLASRDAFWMRMRTHLAEAMGSKPPGDLVDSVRARLPRDLLEPNLARAEELRASRPELARLHMTAVRESGLPAEAVAEVRRTPRPRRRGGRAAAGQGPQRAGQEPPPRRRVCGVISRRPVPQP